MPKHPGTDARSQRRSALAGRVARSPIGRAAVLPSRIRTLGSYHAPVAKEAARWLAKSREYTNFTYDLQPVNRKQLAGFVADVVGSSYQQAMGWLDELEDNRELREFLVAARDNDPQRRLSDPVPRYGRRAGWYAIARGLQPDHIVETGTDKGLGSMVLAAALLANGKGTVTTIDVQQYSGYLIGGRWAEVIDRRLGDSHAVIPTLAPIDMFLHDSLHTAAHEVGEFDLAHPLLTERAVLLSDSAHYTDLLLEWAAEHDLRFQYFQEWPLAHWYRGAGIGLAQRR